MLCASLEESLGGGVGPRVRCIGGQFLSRVMPQEGLGSDARIELEFLTLVRTLRVSTDGRILRRLLF